jgi:hypothetical protein
MDVPKHEDEEEGLEEELEEELRRRLTGPLFVSR